MDSTQLSDQIEGALLFVIANFEDLVDVFRDCFGNGGVSVAEVYACFFQTSCCCRREFLDIVQFKRFLMDRCDGGNHDD